MRKRTFKTLFMAILTILCSVFVMNSGKECNVMAAENTFEMVQGGSIRIKEPYGLRFQVKMDAAIANNADKVGMLIFPADYLVDNGIYGDIYYESVQEIVSGHKIDLDLTENLYEKDGSWYGNGAIVNIKEKNMSREFVGIAYYEMNGTTVWADTTNLEDTTRSAAQVALLTHADKEYTYSTDATTVLLNYVDRLKAADVEEGAPTRFQVRGYAADNGLRFYIEQYVDSYVDTGDTEQTHLEAEILQENISGGENSTYYRFWLNDTYECDDSSNVKSVTNEANVTDRGESFEGYRYKISYEIFIEFNNSVDDPCAYVQFKHYLPGETEDGLGYVYKKYTDEEGTYYYWQDKCNSFEVRPTGIVAKKLYDYNSDLFYQNLGSVQVADPSVITVGDTFYLYATDASEGYNCTSIRVWSSKNLSDWKEVGKAFVPAEDAWAVDRLWAPEVIESKGKYYMYYSGYNRTNEEMGIGVAVSDSPTGPFHEIEGTFSGKEYSRTEMPINFGFSAIDPNPFIDDDGQVYLYVAQDQVDNVSSIYGCRLGSDMVTVEEESITTDALVVPQNSENAATTGTKYWNEAPHMYKYGNNYYLIFSSGYYKNKSYCLGIATSNGPLSGFSRVNYNPILKALDTWTHVSGTGHCSLFPSPDGTELWMAYHSHTDTMNGGTQRKINFDKVSFDNEGRLVVSGPSVTPQVLPSGVSDYGNIASEATVTATNNENISLLTDGIVNYRTGTDDKWVSAYEYSSEGTNEITFTFGEAHNIKGIMIYDGADLTKGGQKVNVMIGNNPYEMTLDSSSIPGTASILEIDETEASKVTLTFTENVNLSEVVILAEKTRSSELSKIELTTNYFTEAGDGVYTLTMDSAGEGGVDDVKQNGSVIREAYYSIKGTITLDTNADWTQARILVSSDPNNEHIIAMERVDGTNYQIFAMSKNNENIWNDWRLVSHATLNGSQNSINFEVIANGRQIYFLIDDEICYTSNRVSMTESTVKFSCAINNQAEDATATTTVKNLDGQIFEDKQAVEDYLRTKSGKVYESPLQARIDEHYNDYITNNGCTGKGGTLLLGHSHIDRLWWSEWETQTGLTNYVNGYNVGIGGSTTFDWLHAYDKLVKPFDANRFVISLGENDITVWGEDGDAVVDRLEKLFEKIHTDFPKAEIYYIYSLPSPTKYIDGKYVNAKYDALVKGEKELCESLDYVQGIDTFDVLATVDKKNANAELFSPDNVHLNEKGYEVWSDYLYDKIFKGENFGVTMGDGISYKTTNGIELMNDTGSDATINMFGSSPRYAYLNGSYADKFYFETEVDVREILDGDIYPKFGFVINNATEMVKFYLAMNTEMKVSQVGVVHQPTGQGDDWDNQNVKQLGQQIDLSKDTVKLALLRDGASYFFYVNDKLVIVGADLTTSNSAVGFFSFATAMNLTNYNFTKSKSQCDELLKEARKEILQVNSANTSISTVEVGGSVWSDKNYTFTDIPQGLIGKSYVYGKINTEINVTILQNCYIYVLTPLETHVSFPKNITKAGSGFVQLDISTDWCYANYNNPIDTLVFEKQVTAGDEITIDASWGILIASEKQLDLGSMLEVKNGATLENVAIGAKIWSDQDYEFISMPEEMIGKPYVYGKIGDAVEVTVQKDGYLYVVTPPRTDSHFAKDVDLYDFERLELPQWTYASYSNKLHTWVYEKKVSQGEQIKIGAWWGVLVASEERLDLTDNGVTVPDSELAIIESDTYDIVPTEMKQQVFSDQANYYLHTIPYWLAGKNMIAAPLNGGTATVTKAGKLYMIGRNQNNANKDFQKVMDLDFEPWGGAGYGGGEFANFGFALYVKDVEVGEEVTWLRWGVPIFYSDKQLPKEPLSSITDIEIARMPQKTTYKIGEDFDTTGLVVLGTDINGNKVELNPEDYIVAPSTFSSDVLAVSVIVNNMIEVIPVTVTDASGNEIVGNTEYSTKGFTTQQAPIVTGSISQSTVEDVILTIKKEEADGATAFIVFLTTLKEDDRDVESLRRIAECTEYPVMAIAYGNYDNLDMRLELLQNAVRAGFEAVDIPMDTYSVSDTATKMSQQNTILSSASPREVSMDEEVASQQMAFIAELRKINPNVEILISAHVGVSLTPKQGVALATEMKNRGADIAKIVLGSSANHLEVLNTNMILKEELGIPFYYNCTGAASRPYRIAAGLMGTQIVFCCAEYHKINTSFYDYVEDLVEFYNTIPELYKEVKEEKLEFDLEGLKQIDLSSAYTWSTSQSSVGGSAQAAFDGKMDTRWCANGADKFPSTLLVDLQSQKAIEEIKVHFEQASEWEYKLYVSQDGLNWTEYGGNPDGAKQEEYTNKKDANARYVKIDITGAGLDPDGNPCWASIWELEVFEKDTKQNVALNCPCAATSSSDNGGSAAAAFDDDVFTRYCALNEQMPQTLIVDLGETTQVGAIYLMFEQYSKFEYALETSLDGDSWIKYGESSGDSVFETIHRGEKEARYVRLTVTGSSDGAWASIREFKVFVEE